MFASMSIISNTYQANHDGWGIFGGGEVFKTEMNAQMTSNIGEWVNKVHIKTSPMITHVRLASIGGKVCQENSHPFETTSFVLAHNGTLVIKRGKEVYINGLKTKWKAEKPDIIDSEVFALVLEEEYKFEKDFVKVLNKTMDNFCGKFAFIIYCKPEDSYYIVRGKSADLHVVTFTKEQDVIAGIAVNTEKTSLERTIHIFENCLQANNLILKHTDIEELAKETIYKFGANKLVKVGEIKESEKEYGPFPSTTYNRDYTRNSFSGNNGFNEKTNTDLINDVLTYMNLYSLSLEDLDRILFFTMNKGILRITEDEMVIFLKKVTPKLCAVKKFRKEIDETLTKNKFQIIPQRFYEKATYPFPYMLISGKQDQRDFVKLLGEYLKEMWK
jgi:predicted glutamine amidotransferase